MKGQIVPESANSGADSAAKSVVMTRLFDAPRELAFRVWTDSKQVAQWWGPKHFTNPVCEVDARPEGGILIHMQGPDGSVYPMAGTFEEVIELERLVFVSVAVENDAGEPQLTVRTSVTFEDADGKTKITVQADVVTATDEAAGALAGMEQGWAETLDSLGEYLAKA